MRKQGALAAGGAAVTVVLWASAFVAIRHVGQEISAGALSLGRLLVGSVLLGIFVFTRPRRWPKKADWKFLLACGVLWFGAYNVALNAAERHLDAGTTSMLVNIGPLLIAMLAGVLLHEGFPRQLVIGSVVAFGGVVLIGLSSSGGGAEVWGVVLCLAAAAAYAIGVVSQKPLLARLPALEVTWLSCVIGTVACLPFGPALVREVRPSTIWWVVFLGAFPTAIAFTTWAYALARTTAGRMGATTYLVPPITIVLGWLLLGETPAPLAYGGGALCLVGVAISRYRRMPATKVDRPDSKPLSKS